jgi:hypothetical protein
MVIEDSLYGFLPSVHFDLTPKVFRSADLKNDKSRLPNSSELEFGSRFHNYPGNPRDFGQPQDTREGGR